MQIIIIGIGNLNRSDGAAGRLVARRLAEKLKGIGIKECNGKTATLIGFWQGAEKVILIDAVCSGRKPGTIHRFDASSQPVPARRFHCSTHAFSIAEAIELARSWDRLPSQVIVYAIEGKKFEYAQSLTPEVRQAVEQTAKMVRNELHQ